MKNKEVSILDLRLGNLRSITRSLIVSGYTPRLVNAEKAISSSSHLILPGVGAFPAASQRMQAAGLDQAVKEFAKAGKPLLGICLGMQLLLDESSEISPSRGLGLVSGRVERINETRGVKLPHTNWCSLHFVSQKPSTLFHGVCDGASVYFSHSYQCMLHDHSLVTSTCSLHDENSFPLTASIGRENVLGVQFHPEKSGSLGLTILKNFCASS